MIDIGANLAHESFAHDLDAVLSRAWAAGLERILITGSCRGSNATAASIAAAHPTRCDSTAGVHPHHASDWDADDAARIRALAAEQGIVAVGECGLDYHRNFSTPQDQRRAFAAQLELAVALQLPVFLHQRDAHTDFLPMLREVRAELPAAVVHCFTDTAAAAEDYLALDCYIGITGWVCDQRRGASLREVIPKIPADRLLVETDAPYLLPHNLPKALKPKDARRNEPAFLPWVVAQIAALRGEPDRTVAAYTRDNAVRCFGLAP